MATRPTSDRLREALFNVLAPRIESAAFLDLYAGSGAVGIEALSRGAAQVAFVEQAPAALKVLRANLDRLRIATGYRIHSGSVASFLRKPQALAATVKTVAASIFDIVFLDPPYDAAEEYATALGLLGSTSQAPEELDLAKIPKGFVSGHDFSRAANAALSIRALTPEAGPSRSSSASETRSAGLLAAGALVIAEHRRKLQLQPQYGALQRTRLLEQGDAALSFYAANPDSNGS